LQAALEKRGFCVELHTDLAVVSGRANELFAENRLQALVGVGGDGTAAELTNRTVPGVPIAILPSGTANLIAKYLKIPFNPEKLAATIAEGATISFDAGRANGRLFLVMVSAGIDADVVRQVHAAREESYRRQTKKGAHISYLSYIKPIFGSISSYYYPRIKTEFVDASGSTREIVGKWPFVFNLPRYGWGLPLVPRCVGVDGRLDYCIFKGGKLFLALFDVFCAQMFSSHRLLPNAKLGVGTTFRLTAADSTAKGAATIPYQIDGDPGGVLPVEIETVPNRFTAVAPAAVVARLERARR
jgi:diacylglycerol kinase family enzyme